MSNTVPGLPTNNPVNITGATGSLITEYYRYYKQGDTPGAWLAYTGSETMAINNATSNTVNYIIEKRRILTYYGYSVQDKTQSFTIPIPPTSQPTISNFAIDPIASQAYGSWDISFDIDYDPAWSGNNPVVRLDVDCFDGFGDLQINLDDISLAKVGNTYTGTVTIAEEDQWEWMITNPGKGYFNAYVICSAITGTTVPSTSDSHEFSDVWDGLEIIKTCWVYEQVGMYDWGAHHEIHRCPAEYASNVTSGQTIRWFLNYDSDGYASSENIIYLKNAAGVTQATWYPSDDETGTTLNYATSGLTGDITGWYFVIEDSYGDGGIQVNWSCMTVDEASPSCYLDSCPEVTTGDGSSCELAYDLLFLTATDYDTSFLDWITYCHYDVEEDERYLWVIVNENATGPKFVVYNTEESGRTYEFDVYDIHCNLVGSSNTVNANVWDYTFASAGYYRIRIKSTSDENETLQIGFYS